MKVVRWVRFLATTGLVGIMTWAAAGLAFFAFRDGLAWLGVPLALGAVLFACIMVRGVVVGLLGE